jgi:hypothetical protein
MAARLRDAHGISVFAFHLRVNSKSAGEGQARGEVSVVIFFAIEGGDEGGVSRLLDWRLSPVGLQRQSLTRRLSQTRAQQSEAGKKWKHR